MIESLIGFFRKACADMRESARAQHEVDKANFAAAKAESKARFEEARALGRPETRKAAMQAQRDKQIADAQARKYVAEIRAGMARGEE